LAFLALLGGTQVASLGSYIACSCAWGCDGLSVVQSSQNERDIYTRAGGFLFWVLVEGPAAHTQQGCAHSRRLHPSAEAARPALMTNEPRSAQIQARVASPYYRPKASGFTPPSSLSCRYHGGRPPHRRCSHPEHLRVGTASRLIFDGIGFVKSVGSLSFGEGKVFPARKQGLPTRPNLLTD
jgi:hypothetical protein